MEATAEQLEVVGDDDERARARRTGSATATRSTAPDDRRSPRHRRGPPRRARSASGRTGACASGRSCSSSSACAHDTHAEEEGARARRAGGRRGASAPPRRRARRSSGARPCTGGWSSVTRSRQPPGRERVERGPLEAAHAPPSRLTPHITTPPPTLITRASTESIPAARHSSITSSSGWRSPEAVDVRPEEAPDLVPLARHEPPERRAARYACRAARAGARRRAARRTRASPCARPGRTTRASSRMRRRRIVDVAQQVGEGRARRTRASANGQALGLAAHELHLGRPPARAPAPSICSLWSSPTTEQP